LQAPIVIADRIQCFVDLQVTSARTLREREDDVARHYIAERRVRDGDLGARAAFASLIELIGRLGLQHPFIVLEGGSISLLSLLSQMHRSGNLPFRMSLDMMTMGDEAAHRKRLAARARQMLAPPSGAPGLLDEFAGAWKDPAQRSFLASINGLEAIVQWCHRRAVDPVDLVQRELSPAVLDELVDAVTKVHFDHGKQQMAAFAAMFGNAPLTILSPKMSRPPRVTVFCGARTGSSPAYMAAAAELGSRLATAGFEVVYGGASIGLMGALADGALTRGGVVTGVIPRGMVDVEIEHRGLTSLHVVESMHERKALMIKLADAFVALPGGLGTGEELLEVLTWRQLGLHACPCLLLDVDRFWSSVLEPMQNVVKAGFVRDGELQSIGLCPNPGALVARLVALFADRMLVDPAAA
jgi:uncharacterized protein (TIGR00730 family)